MVVYQCMCHIPKIPVSIAHCLFYHGSVKIIIPTVTDIGGAPLIGYSEMAGGRSYPLVSREVRYSFVSRSHELNFVPGIHGNN